MRRLVNGSLLVMSVAGLLMAQHGGHSGGGGGHAGGGGFHASSGGYSSGFHSSGGGGYVTSITPQSYSGHLTLSTPPAGATNGFNRSASAPPHFVESRPSWGRPPIRRPGAGYDRYRGYYGIGYYPVIGYGYYGDDFYSPYSDSGPVAEQYYAPYEQGPEAVSAYSSQVPYTYPADPQQGQPPLAAPQAPEVPSVPITVVLKNGQKLVVQNYAIMNGLFWDFSKQNAKKIALSDIDVEASVKATDEAGGAFPVEAFGVSPR